MSPIRIKRIYDPVEPGDGYRILVDRLWPRGMKKEQAALDQWAKSITPSTEIRKEFHHDPSRFSEFRQKYLFELENNPESETFRRQVIEKLHDGPVTLLYGAKDREVNHATVMKEWLEKEGLSES
jgi:uncharacterized protein YeaO (DUF488 family)